MKLKYLILISVILLILPFLFGYGHRQLEYGTIFCDTLIETNRYICGLGPGITGLGTAFFAYPALVLFWLILIVKSVVSAYRNKQ
jgi:hypothetical protein